VHVQNAFSRLLVIKTAMKKKITWQECNKQQRQLKCALRCLCSFSMMTFIHINLIYFNIKHFNISSSSSSSTNKMHVSILKLIYIHRDLLHVSTKNIHHLQEGKIQRMSTLKIIIILLILCIIPPWRWSCVWLKPKENVGVHCVHKLISKYFCAFCRYYYYIFSVQFSSSEISSCLFSIHPITLQ